MTSPNTQPPPPTPNTPGSNATTHVRAGTPWGTQGLLTSAVAEIEAMNAVAVTWSIEDEEDGDD